MRPRADAYAWRAGDDADDSLCEKCCCRCDEGSSRCIEDRAQSWREKIADRARSRDRIREEFSAKLRTAAEVAGNREARVSDGRGDFAQRISWAYVGTGESARV